MSAEVIWPMVCLAEGLDFRTQYDESINVPMRAD